MTSSMDATEGGEQRVLVLVTWSSSKAKSKLWAHANEKSQRVEMDKNNSMNHGNIRTASWNPVVVSKAESKLWAHAI